MKAKDLPMDLLLDAFLHLPPIDVDRSLRFVSKTYSSLVKVHGVTILPKYSVELRCCPPPAPKPFQCYGSNNKEAISRFFDKAGIDVEEMRALLSEKRLGRISRIVFAGGSLGTYARLNWQNWHLFALLNTYRETIKALNPTCMEVHYCESDFSAESAPLRWLLPQLSQYVHHFSGGRTIPRASSLLSTCGVGHLIYNLNSINCSFEPYKLVSKITSAFRKATRLSDFPFPTGDLLIFSHRWAQPHDNALWTQWLGEPDELRYIAKLDSEDFHGHSYYRKLDGSEWMVWRIHNPRLSSAEKDGMLGDSGKYIRVMFKLKKNEVVGFAVHIQLFTNSEMSNEEKGS